MTTSKNRRKSKSKPKSDKQKQQDFLKRFDSNASDSIETIFKKFKALASQA